MTQGPASGLPGFSDRHAADFLRGFVSANRISKALIVTSTGPASAELVLDCGTPEVWLLPATEEAGSALRAGRKGLNVLDFDGAYPAMPLSSVRKKGGRFDLILFESRVDGYPGWFELTKDLLGRKGHFLFTDILAPAGDADGTARRTAVVKELEPFVAGLHRDRLYEARMINLGNGLLLVRRK